MKTNKFNPVLEAIPNKSSYSPSALFGHSIRMMLDNSANAEVQFQEPKDGGVLDVVISCSEGSRCQVVCHIQKDSLNIDFSAADEKAPASKAQFPAPVLRPEELKSVRIPTDEEWDAFMDVTGENNDLANWKTSIPGLLASVNWRRIVRFGGIAWPAAGAATMQRIGT